MTTKKTEPEAVEASPPPAPTPGSMPPTTAVPGYYYGVRFFDGPEGLLVEFKADPHTIVGPRPATQEDIDKFPNAYSAYTEGGGTTPPAPGEAPTLESLAPDTAVADGSPVPVTVTGTGFTDTSKIVWGGAEVATTFTDETSVSTVAENAGMITGDVTVVVRNGTTDSNALTFTFTDPVARSTRSRK